MAYAELKPDGSLNGEIEYQHGDEFAFFAKKWTSSTACQIEGASGEQVTWSDFGMMSFWHRCFFTFRNRSLNEGGDGGDVFFRLQSL
jgi:hypothetical protein